MNKKRIIFTVGSSLALIAFIIASISHLKEPDIDKNKLTNIKEKIKTALLDAHVANPEDKLAKFKEKIKVLEVEYQKRNDALLQEFEKDIMSAGQDDFQNARKQVAPTVKYFCGFKACSTLIYSMARDKIKHSETAKEFVFNHIEHPVLNPCIAGAAKIQSIQATFIHKLQENNNRFASECFAELNSLAQDKSDFIAGQKFLSNLNVFESHVEDFAESAVWTGIGVSIEAILWKQTYKAILRFAGKTITKVAGSAAAPFLDGPLPIGDIIAVGGAAWCAWDIYRLTKILPQKISDSLNTAINSFENNSRQEALAVAREAFKKSTSAMNRSVEKIMEVK